MEISNYEDITSNKIEHGESICTNFSNKVHKLPRFLNTLLKLIIEPVLEKIIKFY